MSSFRRLGSIHARELGSRAPGPALTDSPRGPHHPAIAAAPSRSNHRMMNRRAFVGVLGAVLAGPLGAEAQQTAKIPRIGVLTFGHSPTATNRFNPNDGFRDGLRNLGYVEGRNVAIEWRYAEARTDRLAELAADLVRLKIDVIFAGGPVVLEAAMKATTSIPIVVVCCSDAVREGWAQSVARPGGNITGLTVTYPEIGGKRLALLKEAVPGCHARPCLWNPRRFLIGAMCGRSWTTARVRWACSFNYSRSEARATSTEHSTTHDKDAPRAS
jgi:hypothetical protein